MPVQNLKPLIGLGLGGMAVALLARPLFSWLFRVLPKLFGRQDPFGHNQLGFPQERKRLVSSCSLHLAARYTDRGKSRKSWINFVNPRRGVLILGSPGCGKTWFIIEPLISQLLQKGYALFVYDYKFDSLSRYVYEEFLANRRSGVKGVQFYCINFTDLRRTHRCNVLEPASLTHISDALGMARTVLLSINKTWVNRQGDFFVESPINFLGAIIWYLKKYEGGKYCTLPHAIELAQYSYKELFPILNSVSDIQALMKAFMEAEEHRTFEMLDGQIASARIPLGRLVSPDIYYVLTGDEVGLDINDRRAPKVFCLGGSAVRQEALAPILSLFTDRLNRRINREGGVPCGLVCDEFATVRAYTITELVATARSNNIIPILSVQDLNQLKTQYTHTEAETILNIAGNVICGQVGGDTARWLSERFPRIQQERVSTSENQQGSSETRGQSWEPSMSPATIGTLSSGEFAGVVADEPGTELPIKVFHARIRPPKERTAHLPPLPLVRDLDEREVQEQFERVRKEVRELVSYEKSRVAKEGGGS